MKTALEAARSNADKAAKQEADALRGEATAARAECGRLTSLLEAERKSALEASLDAPKTQTAGLVALATHSETRKSRICSGVGAGLSL